MTTVSTLSLNPFAQNNAIRFGHVLGSKGRPRKPQPPARQAYIVGPVTTIYSDKGPVLSAFLYKPPGSNPTDTFSTQNPTPDAVLMFTPGGPKTRRRSVVRIGGQEMRHFGPQNPNDPTAAGELVKEGGTVYLSHDGRVYPTAETAKKPRPQS